jgi:UDPglucose 6-dehydrogenase
LIRELVQRGAKVNATDPQALETGHERFVAYGIAEKVTLFKNEYEAVKGADALVVATEWNEYRSPDLTRVKELMRGRAVFDGRNALVPEAVADAGLIYRGMGRQRKGA